MDLKWYERPEWAWLDEQKRQHLFERERKVALVCASVWMAVAEKVKEW